VLSAEEAATVLWVPERTFRRWRGRFEAEGAEGVCDRPLGRLSTRRPPEDEVARVLDLHKTRYERFTAKHFYEKLVEKHGFGSSYNWLRLTLQAHGPVTPAPRRASRKRMWW
jgi:transposase